MAKIEHPFTVGQEVVISHVNFKPRRATVTKVGRTLVTVGRDAFRLSTRRTNDAYGNGTLFTVEEWEDRCAREALVHDLRGAGLHFHYVPPDWMSTTCLREMVDVIDRHRPKKTGE